ncbi:signal peptidase [Streptomyces eurocidicus]|uniref:Putative membrane protein YeaQ/YmgE (Transglycosylase-associated protein family) n=1 Tax=Streptomyces eurocidicus TaxID=66423 RepID=A0A2N8NM71_STREU|nr:GlsB/YeaQ/YmgE family stress response membrane protein [Streptomyces eurocidicus]MBB5118339.1 putative membrane protein YeaQ/YmgE (transglycosylase-associated protein family) [Streptomyces eurocidicus]MBF6051162.1 GlsB/YeaQ/YmgE family stress response membrane protein [Streptomyces eurocidicus]PNE29862.1 signal peptidase [Streptomyces eurocidicus]
MSWLWAIIVGLVLGLIAKAILPGKQQIPLWLTVIFGMIGSVLGNWAATGLGINDTKGIDWGRHLLQLAGAVLVVAIGDRLWVGMRGGKKSHA